MSKIVIVGEAWGEDEAMFKHPFVGKSGVELYRMLCDAGFPLEPITKRFVSQRSMIQLWKNSSITLLNVFNSRPPDPEKKNRVSFFFSNKKGEGDETFPRYGRDGFPLPKYVPHIKKLWSDLETLKPNIIITLGNTSMWALLEGQQGIKKAQGTVHISKYGKLIPTLHPAYILRAWDDRPKVIANLIKARTESEHPQYHAPSRKIWISPSLEDLKTFWDNHLSKSSLITVDIETERNEQISEIGFAANQHLAIHIPFLIIEKAHGKILKCERYWKTQNQEICAWDFVHKVMTSSNAKLFQNGMYDMYWLWKKLAIPTTNAKHDTMLLHHALYPEFEKGLGLLGSLYTPDRAWKSLRRESNKPDE